MTPSDLPITLPFAVLVSDNARHGTLAGKILLTERYRTALDRARLLVLAQVRGQRPRYTGPVKLEAHVWLPDARRRDVANLRKLVTDALSTVVYADDVWVHDERWIRRGIDRTNPRVELFVGPLGEEA